jgi:methylmalonyl-CoA mutase N-terminal domain/subunit
VINEEETTEVTEAKRKWERDVLEPYTAKAPERKGEFTTLSGEPVERLYTAEDTARLDPVEDLGFPGAFPYTRGVYPTMYRGRLWTMRQFAGFGSAEDTNHRFRYLLDHGMTGLSTAFDMPTLMGRDSDDPLSRGEIGKCGVAIDSLVDMEILFDQIPLDRVTTSMTINGPAAILLAFYVVAGEKKGITPDKLGGTIQTDILKEYIAQKEWLFPPEPSIKVIVDMFEYCSREMPKWHPVSISGYHIREAGATALQELAFTLIDGLTYVEAAVERGLDVDGFAPRLSFFFDSHNDFFEEIAKFRAARRIWAREMKRRYSPKSPRSYLMRFHTQTAGCSLVAQQPYNNVARVALQALAAVLGGTQSLHTNSLDETYALPSQEAVTIALRTQQIIAEESGVTNTIDPLAGSYFVEGLTDRMEKGFYDYLEKIEAMGGMVKAIEKAFPQREIAQAAFRYQEALDSKDKIVVGLNDYIQEAPPIETLVIDEEVGRKQVERLEKTRADRDDAKWRKSLDDLKAAAKAGDNIMPYLVEATRAYATVGEIAGALKEVYGTYEEPAFF